VRRTVEESSTERGEGERYANEHVTHQRLDNGLAVAVFCDRKRCNDENVVFQTTNKEIRDQSVNQVTRGVEQERIISGEEEDIRGSNKEREQHSPDTEAEAESKRDWCADFLSQAGII